MKDILSVILGGGRGNRLFPLTKQRSKPAVPIAGKYRLVDIPISNCLNSGLNKVYVLTQFNSESLNKHISRSYQLDSFFGGFVEIIAAEQTLTETEWFQGTADAVRQSLRHLQAEPGIQHVLVLSGDHLYTMDFRPLILGHRRAEADVTICCQPVPASEAARFGLMRADAQGRAVDFAEKPKDRAVVERFTDSGGRVLASMGIYLFNRQVLIDLLTQGQETDFGRELLPKAINRVKVMVHRYEGYWEDIGTIRTFYEANLALTQPFPPINLFSQDWLIYTHARYLPPATVREATLEHSLVVDGCRIERAQVSRSVIGVRGVVGAGCQISDTVFFGADYYEPSVERPGGGGDVPPLGIGHNCIIHGAIIDKNARIGAGCRIVNEAKAKTADGPDYAIRDGIIVIEKNAVVPPGTVI